MAAAAASIALIAAAPAGASDLCVGSSPLCPVSAYASSGSGIQQALDDAKNVSHPGLDRVILAAGVFSTATMLHYSDATGEPVQILGQGAGTTTIVPTTGGIVTMQLGFVNTAATSSISNLTLGTKFPETGFPTGLSLAGGQATGLEIDVNSSGTNTAYGAQLGNSAEIHDTTFNMSNDYAAGLYANTDTNLSGLVFNGDPTSITYGIAASGGSNYGLSKSTFSNLYESIENDSGMYHVRDVVIDMGDISNATALRSSNTNNSNYTPGITASNVTVVGTGPNQRGAEGAINGTGTSTVQLANSIFDLTGSGSTEFMCSSGSVTSTANFSADYVLWNPASSSETSCTQNVTNQLDRTVTPPVFVGGGDYTLVPGSAGIDAGDPAFTLAPGETDVRGEARVVDGNGDCVARVDMGATEVYVPAPACSPQPPAPTPIQPGPAPTFSLGKASGKFKLPKKPKPFALGNAKSSPRIPLTTNFAGTLKLTLAAAKQGYKSGTKCVKRKPKTGKPKRCDLPLKGSQSIAVPSGAAFLSFGGKWGRKALAPGKYVLSATAAGVKDAKKSTLSVVR